MKKIGVIDHVNSLTPEQFHSNYVLQNNPVIIKDVVEFWRGYKLWSLGYFDKNYRTKLRYVIIFLNQTCIPTLALWMKKRIKTLFLT